jgi:hypothetical protein
MKRKDREITATDEILQIIEKAKFLHLGLFDDKYPYVVPLHYGYEFKDGKLFFFLHSAKEGHKLDLINKNPNVCIELECDVEPVSGGDIPCKYGATYESVIGRGTAELITDADERIRGLDMLMKHQTGRSFHIDEAMADSVEVIKVTVSDFTAKARNH